MISKLFHNTAWMLAHKQTSTQLKCHFRVLLVYPTRQPTHSPARSKNDLKVQQKSLRERSGNFSRLVIFIELYSRSFVTAVHSAILERHKTNVYYHYEQILFIEPPKRACKLLVIRDWPKHGRKSPVHSSPHSVS